MKRMLSIGILAVSLLIACTPRDVAYQFVDLPVGNATNGETLFHTAIGSAPTCNTCHNLDGAGGGVGPSLLHFGETAQTRVAGQSAGEYTFNSLLSPAKFIVTGYSNVMYSDYAKDLTAQQTADLIAYLLKQ